MTHEGDGSGTSNGTRYGATEPAHHGDERTAVTGFLQRQRDLVAWKVRGADDEALRGQATATGLTAHRVVRHLSNVERSWIRDVFAGEVGLGYNWTDKEPDGELRVPLDVTIEQLLADYATEAALCDAVVARSSLDDLSTTRGMTLRWILLHLVEETARHLGHLDLLREQADGAVGEEPGAHEG